MTRRLFTVLMAALSVAARRVVVGSVFISLSIATPGLGQTPSAEPPDERQIRAALLRGDYHEGEQLAVRRLAIAETMGGPDSLEAAKAIDLVVEAQLRSGLSNNSAVLARAERAVVLKERLLGGNDVELALSMHNLCAIQADRGDYGLAIPSCQRALTVRRNHLSPGAPEIADTLEALVIPFAYMERFAEARSCLEESRTIRLQAGTSRSLELGRNLFLEALVDRRRGDYPAANSTLSQAVEIFQSGESTPLDRVATYQLQGDLAFFAGRFGDARSSWTQSLELARETFGAEHASMPRLLRLLAATSADSGNLAEAHQLLQRAVSMAERILAACHPEIPTLLNDFAALLTYDGNYNQASRFYARGFAIAEHCLGPRHSLTVTITYNRAELALAMGDIAESERLNQRAVDAWRATLGPNHPYVARGLDALADSTAASGRLSQARQHLERALAIRRRALGDNHPDVAVTLIKLARITDRAGDIAGAQARVLQALAIFESGGQPQDPDYLASSIELRGALEARDGNQSAARKDYAEALAVREKIFGSSHPLTAQARVELATADLALGAPDAALAAALAGETGGRDHLRFTIRSLPERQALDYAAKRPRGLDLAISIIAAHRSDDLRSVLDAVIRSRGVILDELAERTRHQTSTDDENIRPLITSAATARERFAALMLRSLKGDDPVAPSVLADARTKKEEAESALAAASASDRNELLQAVIGVDDVQSSLPRGSVLVSFVRYQRTTFEPARQGLVAKQTPSYLAFVADADTATVSAVPVGAAAPIDRLVQLWRDEAGGRSIAAGLAPAEATRLYRVAGANLRARVWDPLAPFLVGATHLFIVPDGALNLVSFAALPVAQGRYLVESGVVTHVLSTERDVVQTGANAPGKGLLAVGGAAYNLLPQAPQASAMSRRGCDTAGSLKFDDLPGTRAEVQDISNIWRGQAGSGEANEQVTVLSGRAASETAVAEASAGRRILHFATHGFVAIGGCADALSGTRGVGGLAPAGSKKAAEANPLPLSGLAFAGANLRASARPDRADGILTAEEVTSLNLQGTEWAVLSACDTGLGEIRAGEGVFGLRRAFQIAGARTVIMSLWSVEDQSARTWMRLLYEGRLQQRLSTADAVHQASLRLLTTRRARGQTTHPFYWAAFVAAGDWR